MVAYETQKKQKESQLEKILETACAYHDEGIFVVVVHSHLCKNNIKAGKAPTTFGWQKNRMSKEQLIAEITRVFAREGSCNIGIKTGKDSNLLVLDVDDVGWFLENELHLGNPIIERRGSEGLHLYYKYPEGYEEEEIPTASSGGRVIKGVDILADGTAQVVTYPSIHKTGDQYLIDNGLSLLDVSHEASEPPAWLLEELFAQKKARALEERGKDTVSENPVDIEMARQALLSMKPAVQGDGGDLLTLQAAMTCRDYGLSQSTVYELLRKEYNPRCQPEWSDEELRQKVKNAFSYARRAQGSMSVQNIFDTNHDTSLVEREIEESKQRYSKKHPVKSAKVFLDRHGENFRCFNGQFVHYDQASHKWKLISDSSMDAVVYKDVHTACHGGSLINEMKINHISDIRKAIKWTLDVPEDIPSISWLDPIFRDRGLDCISLSNGILNVATGDVYDHTSQWFSFHALDIEYDEDAKCPEFLQFLGDIWDNDNELVQSLQLWMGYCLLNKSDLQRFALFKGTSRAGKGTIVRVIESLMGEGNSVSKSLSSIGGDFGLQSLLGKKLCIFQDADRASSDRTGVATERIKSLSANDPMEINRKNLGVIDTQLNIKLIFVCNKLPHLLNDENSLTNRMIVFPFWKSYHGKEDLKLVDRLLAERSGILNWALVGARRLLRGERLTTATRGQDMVEVISRELDSVKAFFAECVEFTDIGGSFVSNKELWTAYKEWCKDSGRRCKNKQRFLAECLTPEMRDRQSRSNNIRGFERVKLQTEYGFSTGDDLLDLEDPPF